MAPTIGRQCIDIAASCSETTFLAHDSVHATMLSPVSPSVRLSVRHTNGSVKKTVEIIIMQLQRLGRQHYLTVRCRPVIDCKMNDLERPWMLWQLKIRYDLQGCRALTSALARLSCESWVWTWKCPPTHGPFSHLTYTWSYWRIWYGNWRTKCIRPEMFLLRFY